MTRIIVKSLFAISCSVTIESKSKSLFKELVAELKHSIPKDRTFDRDTREWSVIGPRGLSYLESYLATVRRDFPNVEIIRDGRDCSGIRVDASNKEELAAAYRTLYLLHTAPEAVVQASHKALSLLHHPDKGGDIELMKEINAARDLILRRLQQRAA